MPLDFYERFREPLRNHQAQAVGDTEAAHKDTADFDYEKAVATYQQLIRELPPLNKQLLLYILDLLAVFASKSEKNRMTSANLSAIFQPGLLSHPSHDMSPEEYKLSQDVLIFLIENQDHFLFGMNGTAADPQTVQEIQTNATPSPSPAPAPAPATRLRRSASNASAGADSLRKYETLRRNVSVSSKNSRASSNAQSPGTPTSIVGAGVHRSNTVPSKKSPGLASPRLGRGGEPATPTPGGLTPPPQMYGSSRSSSRAPSAHGPRTQDATNTSEPSTTTMVQAQSQTPEQSQLLGPLPAPTNAVTPTRERKLSSFFTKSPPTGTEQKEVRQPNRLRKKRIPGSVNESAQSSSQSLNAGAPDAAAVTLVPQMPTPTSVPASSNESPSHSNRDGHAASQPGTEGGGHHHHQASESTLRPSRSRTPSMHSRSSFTDQSDFDQVEEPSRVDKKENRRSWRKFPLPSKRNNDTPPLMSPTGAEFNASSTGSSTRQRRSSANDSHHPDAEISYTVSRQDSDFGRSTSNLKDPSQSSEPEKRSLFDKFKAKVASMKDGAKEERAKSPPQSDTELSVTSSQNLSQLIKDSRNGRHASAERSRESLDVARDISSHPTSPPVILEEPPSPLAVTEALKASTEETIPAPEPEAQPTTPAPESKTEEAKPSSETQVDEASTPAEEKSEETQGVPENGEPSATDTEPEPVEKN